MESMGDQWTNALLHGIFSNEDDADADQFMAQLLISSSSSLPNEYSTTPCGFSSAFWPPSYDSSTPNSYPIDQYQLYPSFDNTTDNIFTSSHSQDSYYNNNESYYSLSETTHHQSSYYSFGLTNNISFCLEENKTREDIIDSADDELHLRQGIFSGGGNINVQAQAPQLAHADLTELPKVPQASDDDHNYLSMENSRKRSLIISTDHNQKKRNVKPKKNNNPQSSKTSSCCCSKGGDDMGNPSVNATSQSQSQSQSEDASTGKRRGSRGSNSDPQSLYARKRREKINERLRILQNLVPNGTKVDISTMLEEAVQYVKFLQLRIKLLSSDDHWMYAPIAYNGMDIGIDMSIPTPTPTTSS